MFRFIQLMLCLLASVSAFEMPMSRRGLMSKVAAAAPLAAVLPAFADSDNRMYTLVARPAVEQISGAAPTKAVGTAITVDEVWGSAVGKGKEMSAKDAANYDKGNKGIQVRTHTALHHFLYSGSSCGILRCCAPHGSHTTQSPLLLARRCRRRSAARPWRASWPSKRTTWAPAHLAVGV